MKDRRYLTFPQLFALLMLGGSLYLFTGSSGLHLWAQGQENHRTRTIFTSAIQPIKELAERAGISAPLMAVKERFHTLKETPLDLSVFRRIALKATAPPEQPESVGKKEPIPLETEVEVKQALPAEADEESPSAVSPAPAAEIDISPPTLADNDGLPIDDSPDTDETADAVRENDSDNPEEEEEGEEITPSRVAPYPHTILLMGDSLANSTATALVPLADQIPEIVLVNHGKVSSNLSNPVFTDWFAEVDTILEAHRFHTVLLMLGANAAQSISFENREVFWDTPEWNLIYRERAANLIAKLKARTDRVFWVGIPPMLNRGYRERMERQNQIIREICIDQGIHYLPIDTIMGDKDGKYTDYKTLEGRQIKLRLSDNIHYSAAGADLLSRHLIGELYPDLILPRSN